MAKFKDYMNETGLGRIRKHTIEHDCGIITASRKIIISDDNRIKVTRTQNRKRNKILLADLLRKYNITSLRGVYIENYGTDDAIEVGENVFFVVDINDKGQLEKDLFRLGEKWNQNSILFMPKSNGGILIGTSKTLESKPYKSREMFKNLVFGKSGEFTTKVHGRPFVLEKLIISEHNVADSCMFSQWPLAIMSNKDWR